MLYIVRAYDNGDVFNYEYGCIEHAEEHYKYEGCASIIEYNNGKETIIKSKNVGGKNE